MRAAAVVWLLFGLTGFAQSAVAQTLPALKQGMPYVEARKLMIASGWQANINNKLIADHLDKILQAWFIDRNFTEVENCSPTGSGFCELVFHDAAGRLFYIFTTGSAKAPGQTRAPDPVVVSFCLGKETVNCR